MAKKAKGGGFIVDKGADLLIAGGAGGFAMIASIWGAVREQVPLVAIPAAAFATFGVAGVSVALLIRAKRWVYPGEWVDLEDYQRIKAELEEATHDRERLALARKAFCDHADRIHSIERGPELNRWMAGADQLVRLSAALP